jgi:hypothetical protein
MRTWSLHILRQFLSLAPSSIQVWPRLRRRHSNPEPHSIWTHSLPPNIEQESGLPALCASSAPQMGFAPGTVPFRGEMHRRISGVVGYSLRVGRGPRVLVSRPATDGWLTAGRCRRSTFRCNAHYWAQGGVDVFEICRRSELAGPAGRPRKPSKRTEIPANRYNWSKANWN